MIFTHSVLRMCCLACSLKNEEVKEMQNRSFYSLNLTAIQSMKDVWGKSTHAYDQAAVVTVAKLSWHFDFPFNSVCILNIMCTLC